MQRARVEAVCAAEDRKEDSEASMSTRCDSKDFWEEQGGCEEWVETAGAWASMGE